MNGGREGGRDAELHLPLIVVVPKFRGLYKVTARAHSFEPEITQQPHPNAHATPAPNRCSALGRRCNFLPISAAEDEEDDGEEGREEGALPQSNIESLPPSASVSQSGNPRPPSLARHAATARDLTESEMRLTD